ncbi:MAG: GNAT family N-acetyltransferase [bacterium]|nr:GNAT family N-acetyltransferase [bacterium]
MSIWRTVGGHPVCWVARSGDKLAAALPGVEFGQAALRRFQAMPDGCYANIIMGSSSENREELKAATLKGIRQRRYVSANLYDFYNEFPGSDDFECHQCSTLLVSLDSSWEPPDSKIRSEIRKSEREGASVRPFDIDRDFECFIKLVNLTSERQGIKRKYSDQFYRALAELAAKDKRVDWRWLDYQDQAVASHLNFVENDMLLNWQVLSDREFSFLKPNQLLLASAAREAIDLGLTKLNLGATPASVDSLLAYKKKWGGEMHHYRRFTCQNLLGKLVR